MGDITPDCVSNQVCELRMDNLDSKIDNHCKLNDLQFAQLKEDIGQEFKTQTKVVAAAVSAVGFVIVVVEFIIGFLLG